MLSDVPFQKKTTKRHSSGRTFYTLGLGFNEVNEIASSTLIISPVIKLASFEASQRAMSAILVASGSFYENTSVLKV